MNPIDKDAKVNGAIDNDVDDGDFRMDGEDL